MYEEPTSWWKYAYNSILNHYIKPYTWLHIAKHRKNYRNYKRVCIQSLQRPNDTELKLDLQKYEDSLTILNIVIAREHAKQELKNKDIERECQTITSSSKDVNIEILSNNDQSIIVQRNKEESQNSVIDVKDNTSSSQIKLEKSLKQIGERINIFFNVRLLIVFSYSIMKNHKNYVTKSKYLIIFHNSFHNFCFFHLKRISFHVYRLQIKFYFGKLLSDSFEQRQRNVDCNCRTIPDKYRGTAYVISFQDICSC